jgi:hypothetical protein
MYESKGTGGGRAVLRATARPATAEQDHLAGATSSS